GRRPSVYSNASRQKKGGGLPQQNDSVPRIEARKPSVHSIASGQKEKSPTASCTTLETFRTENSLSVQVEMPVIVYGPKALCQDVLKGNIPAGQMLGKLQESLLELDPEFGSHSLLSLPGEREKSESACLSVIALVTDNFEGFTKPQAPAVRLNAEQWGQLRQLISWASPDEETLQAVLVLLAIRSLGKSKRVTQQIPATAQRPEPALLYLMEHMGNVVPSMDSLSERSYALIRDALTIHQDFNLAQMLQGENVSASVLQLQVLVRKFNSDVFKFYILFLLGFM
ncbi:unnamed protein product, partial [Polarella glacialis]